MPQPKTALDLAKPLSQAAFGELVGIGQPAVSAWIANGVLQPGGTAGEWIRAYCERLRQSADSRREGDTLNAARTRLAHEQAKRVAMLNAAGRAEFGPTLLLEAVLVAITRRVAARLGMLVPRLHHRCPALPREALSIIEREIAGMQAVAAGVRLRDGLIEDDPDE